MATIRQVAARAGVSVTTASRALSGGKPRSLCSEKTIRRVEEAAQELGYHLNYHMRSVRQGLANAIGFGMHADEQRVGGQIGSWYFEELRGGLESEAQSAGMNILIVRPDKRRTSFERGVDYLCDQRLDALIIPHAFAGSVKENIKSNSERALRIVTADGPARFSFPHVGFDEEPGLDQLIQHLAKLGHRRVLWYDRSTKHDSPASDRRQELFFRLAFQAGLAGQICANQAAVTSTDTLDRALALLRADFAARWDGFAADSFTAIVCWYDLAALAVQQVLQQKGIRVPEDISVTGFDDSWSSAAMPAITTVSHELFAIGQTAGRLAIEWIRQSLPSGAAPAPEATAVPEGRIVPSRLIVRDSTGPARST